MTDQEKIQRRNRFYFYMVLLVVCIGVSFWSGFRAGKEIEKAEWLDIVNKPECECLDKRI